MTKAHSSVECWACKARISDGQKYCSECDNWQNWRRYVTVSTTFLALAVSFVSVLGFTVPIVNAVLFPEELVIDARIERRELCLAGVGPCKEDSPTRAIFDVNFVSLYSKPILLSDTMLCASQFHEKIETLDEYEYPTLITKTSTLLLPWGSAPAGGINVSYEYRTYQDGAPETIPWTRFLVCIVSIDSRPGKYYSFYFNDGILMSKGIEDLGHPDDGDYSAVFTAAGVVNSNS